MYKWLLPVLFIFLNHFAWSQGEGTPNTPQCKNSQQSEGIGSSAIGMNSDKGQPQALAIALSDAIARVRGTYISSTAQLTEVLQEIYGTNGTSISQSSELRTEIAQSIAGFVTRYDVTNQSVDSQGIVTISVKATVCSDLRIGIALVSSYDLLTATLDSLIGATTATGWQVVQLPALYNQNPLALTKLAFQYGVDLIAFGQGDEISAITNFKITALSVAASISLFDVRTASIVDVLSQTIIGSGFSISEAQKAAGNQIGGYLAKRWSNRLLGNSERSTGSISFTNISRSGTVFKLKDVTESTKGVIKVTAVTYDAKIRVAVITLELSSDLCIVAKEIALNRAFTAWLQTCNNQNASIWVDRE